MKGLYVHVQDKIWLRHYFNWLYDVKLSLCMITSARRILKRMDGRRRWPISEQKRGNAAENRKFCSQFDKLNPFEDSFCTQFPITTVQNQRSQLWSERQSTFAKDWFFLNFVCLLKTVFFQLGIRFFGTQTRAFL